MYQVEYKLNHKSNRKTSVFRPHKGPWFKIPLLKALKKIKVAVKYEYIIDSDVDFLIYLKPWCNRNLKHNVKELIEIFAWCIFYRKSLNRIKFKIDEPEDKLFFFHHGNLASENDNTSNISEITEYLKNLCCKKICHISHFQYDMERGLHNIKLVDPNLIVGEYDIRKLAHNINWGRAPFKLLPFSVRNDFFDCDIPPRQREDAIALTGTIAPPVKGDFFNKCYNTDCLQPERLYLLNLYRYKEKYNCFISNNYDEKKVELNDQNVYFKKDIIELYKENRFSIITSEVVGFPAIGFFEAMASGCIMISTDKDILLDYGLVMNVHYIHVVDYNLVETVIKRYSEKQLENIQLAGKNKAKEFSVSKLSNIFWCLDV